MLKKAIIAIIGALLITSCSQSYDVLYEEVAEWDRNVISPEEFDIHKVLILPTFTDHLYSIQQPADPSATRASDGGYYGPWQDDEDHWLNTRFHTFGLLTRNDVGGSADYTLAQQQQGSGTAACLWDVPMGLTDQQGHTVFYSTFDPADPESVPVSHYHNDDDKFYRYKFFLLGTDNRPVTFDRVSRDKISCTMTLDGETDLIHGFAYHSDKQYDDAISQLPDEPLSTTLRQGGINHLYNRLAGNRGLQPIYNANHLLCRFDIYVKGAFIGDEMTFNFLDVFIDSVKIKTHDKIDITVADDTWERDTYISAAQSGQLIQKAGDAVRFPATIIPRPMQNNDFTAEHASKIGHNDFTLLADEARTYADRGIDVMPESSHWVGDNKPHLLCRKLLLPPILPDGENFALDIKSRCIFTTKGADGHMHLGRGPEVDNKPLDLWMNYDQTVVLPFVDKDGNPITYKAGSVYNIILSVYGKSKITLEVSIGMSWEDGGDIDIDLGGSEK